MQGKYSLSSISLYSLSSTAKAKILKDDIVPLYHHGAFEYILLQIPNNQPV